MVRGDGKGGEGEVAGTYTIFLAFFLDATISQLHELGQ